MQEYLPPRGFVTKREKAFMNTIQHEGGCWPTRQQELLLRAALLQGNDALDAWHEWKSSIDIDQLDQGSHRLLPLLYRNIRVHKIADPLMNILRGVYRSTWYKNQLLFHNMATLLRSFHIAGIQTMILKGAALTLLYYKDYGVRPMQDFDVLVPTKQITVAINLLEKLHWTPILEPSKVEFDMYLSSRHAYTFTDSAGREFDLHWHLLYECLETNADDVFWKDAILTKVSDVSTCTLNSTDQLFHVCVHGVRWNYVPPIRWIADAMMILNSSPEINWNRLVAQAQKRHLISPLKDSLIYLSDLLNAPIPSWFLRTLWNMPVSNIEIRREYKFRIGPPVSGWTGWMGTLPKQWFYYSDMMSSVPLLRRIVGFIGFLQFVWNVDHLWQVPLYAAFRMMRRTWKLAVWYNNQLSLMIKKNYLW